MSEPDVSQSEVSVMLGEIQDKLRLLALHLPRLEAEPSKEFLTLLKGIDLLLSGCLPDGPIIQLLDDNEPKPSKAAMDLIALRDSLIVAQDNQKTDPKPEDLTKLINFLYRKLGNTLTQEGITALEDKGKFNHELQTVIGTQITHDLNLNDQIAETIRPGYQFNQKLIRPQEVVIFSYQSAET